MSTRNYAVFLLALTFCFRCFGQQVTGTPPFGSFSGGPADIVNNANANVHIAIPIFSRSGRGLSFSYGLTYDSAVWTPVTSSGSTVWTPQANWGWSTVTQPTLGYLTYSSSQMSETCPEDPPYNNTLVTFYWTVWQGFVYVDPMGTSHPFNIYVTNYQKPQQIQGSCGASPTTASGTAIDNSGYTLNVNGLLGQTTSEPEATLTDRSGNVSIPNLDASPWTATDTNGNYISVSASGSTTTFVDTFGTTALTVNGSSQAPPMTMSYTNPQGTLSKYTVNYASYAVSTNFGCGGISEYNSPSQPLVSSIGLPDGTSYSLTYEPTPGKSGPVTGRLHSITLPTGGTITYTYSGMNCSSGIPVTMTRQTPDGLWTYSLSGSATTLADPQGNQSVFQFQTTYNSQNQVTGIYETQRKVYQGSSSSGTLLETLDTCYNNSATPCTSTAISLPLSQVSTTTTLPGSGNLVSNTTTLYNSNGFPTEVDQYDFGQGSKGSQISKTTTSYASLSGILGDPSVVQVADGSGNVLQQTTYQYDQGSVTSTSGTPNHNSVSASRGNLTTLTKLVSGSSNLTQTFSY